MPRRKAKRLVVRLALLALVIIVAGCGGPKPAVEDKEKKHIFHVVALAQECETATKKKPTSIDDVKNWAAKEGKASDEDFISPRDQQPYGLVNGMTGLTVFEQTGKNGKCFLYSTGTVREASPDEVSRMKGLAGMRRGGPPGMR